MKNKIRNILFIVFLCIFVYPFIYYFIQSVEGFNYTDPFGQWELLLRQTHDNVNYISDFKGDVNVNITALYDEYGNIKEPNYYNKTLWTSYDFSDNYIFKMNAYEKYNSTTYKTITWSQKFNTDEPTFNSIDTSAFASFAGLVKAPISTTNYIFKGYSGTATDNLYVLGGSQEFLKTLDISYLPVDVDKTSSTAIFPKGAQKVELYLWNPRPNNKNTFNGSYKNLKISKVDMNSTANKNFWNKNEDISGIFDAKTNRYSYCFGKLRCTDNSFESLVPIKTDTGDYKPYCNSDSSLNPVYCEGSAFYNTDKATYKPVSIGSSLMFDMMGKYATYSASNEYFNLFRGLTTPFSSSYVDPEISGNDVIVYDEINKTYVTNNICNFLDNKTLMNGTNLQEECEETRYSGLTNATGTTITEISGNKCIADYGEMINSKYKNYVCKENEVCTGYECGVKFGNCVPSLI